MITNLKINWKKVLNFLREYRKCKGEFVISNYGVIRGKKSNLCPLCHVSEKLGEYFSNYDYDKAGKLFNMTNWESMVMAYCADGDFQPRDKFCSKMCKLLIKYGV